MTIQELRSLLEDAVKRLHEAGDAIDKATAETTDEQRDALQSSFDDAEKIVAKRKTELDRAEARAAARAANPLPAVEPDAKPKADADKRDVKVGAEPATYTKNPDGPSFFRDLVMSQSAMGSDPGAMARLQKHAAEMRALDSTTTSKGTDFVTPLWLNQEWIHLLRAARPFADAVNHMALPPDHNVINFPKLTSGVTVAAQTDGGSVSSTDAATGSINFSVITVAGQQDMSQQLFDRSVPGFDQVIGQDLAAAYATAVDVQCLNGSGSSGNALGVLNTSGINAVTFTSGSPKVMDTTTAANSFYGKVADGIQRIHANRFLPPNLIVMHPVRWAWLLSAGDTTNRPFVVPNANAYNPIAEQNGLVPQGIVGTMQGLPVMVDASIPTNLGGGTNQDIVIICRREDLWLLEDVPRTRVLFEVLSGTLQVRIQLYNYLAFTAGRYPKSVSTVSGTGLVAPTF